MFGSIKIDKRNGLSDTALQQIIDEIMDLPNSLWEIEIRKQSLTNQQLKAIHVFCHKLAAELNGVGARMETTTLFGGSIIIENWDKELVKEHVWKKAQFALLNKKSLRELKTDEVDKVAGPLMDLFYRLYGFGLVFPSRLALYLEQTELLRNKKQ